VSWADAVGFQGSSGAAAGSEKTRAGEAVSRADKRKGGVGSTAAPTGAIGERRLLARDRLGTLARIGVGRWCFGSGRALAQMKAAVTGVAVTAGSASASSAGGTRSPQQPSSAPDSPAAALVASVPELPVQPRRTFPGTRSMRLLPSAAERGVTLGPSLDLMSTAAAALQPRPPTQDSTSYRPSQPETRPSACVCALAAVGSTRLRGPAPATSSGTAPSTLATFPPPQQLPRTEQGPVTASGTEDASTAPSSSGSHVAAAAVGGKRTKAADTSSSPLAPSKPVDKVPTTSTTNMSGSKSVVPAWACDEADTETSTKKRRVGMRFSAFSPPLMPKFKPVVLAAPSTRHQSVEESYDNSVCRLYVEGGRLIAAGRLLKSKLVLHGRVVDADLGVVSLLSVRAEMHSYPYQNWFPPPVMQRSKLRMAGGLQTSIVWSRAFIRVL